MSVSAGPYTTMLIFGGAKTTGFNSNGPKKQITLPSALIAHLRPTNTCLTTARFSGPGDRGVRVAWKYPKVGETCAQKNSRQKPARNSTQIQASRWDSQRPPKRSREEKTQRQTQKKLNSQTSSSRTEPRISIVALLMLVVECQLCV